MEMHQLLPFGSRPALEGPACRRVAARAHRLQLGIDIRLHDVGLPLEDIAIVLGFLRSQPLVIGEVLDEHGLVLGGQRGAPYLSHAPQGKRPAFGCLAQHADAAPGMGRITCFLMAAQAVRLDDLLGLILGHRRSDGADRQGKSTQQGRLFHPSLTHEVSPPLFDCLC